MAPLKGKHTNGDPRIRGYPKTRSAISSDCGGNVNWLFMSGLGHGCTPGPLMNYLMRNILSLCAMCAWLMSFPTPALSVKTTPMFTYIFRCLVENASCRCTPCRLESYS